MGDLIWIQLKFPVAARSRILRPSQAREAGPPAPVLVLGAGVYSDGEPTEVLEARLRAALDLHRSGRAPWFLVSGDNRSLNYNEPMAMRRWLVKQGVPEDRIVSDFAGRRTYDSLRRARDVFGVRTLYVVTSDFHLPRALYLARKLGLEAWGLPASTGGEPLGSRLVFRSREWLARHRAVLDAWFPPDVLLGPREATPDNPGPEGR
jgi:vancomycin permeability regulator SanA